MIETVFLKETIDNVIKFNKITIFFRKLKLKLNQIKHIETSNTLLQLIQMRLKII